jgi:ATP dependent DNA ligase domain
VGAGVRKWHVRDVTPAATRAAAIKGAADLPARSPFMLRPRCCTLKALSCSDPYLDGEDIGARPLIERKARLAALLFNVSSPLHYSDHQRGQGRAFHQKACAMSLEGIVSKRVDAAYAPGNRGLWLKVKCLHREEFVVVGWTA